MSINPLLKTLQWMGWSCRLHSGSGRYIEQVKSSASEGQQGVKNPRRGGGLEPLLPFGVMNMSGALLLKLKGALAQVCVMRKWASREMEGYRPWPNPILPWILLVSPRMGATSSWQGCRCSFIWNHQTMETTQLSINWWINYDISIQWHSTQQ